MAICIADGGAATVRDLPSSGLIHNHRTVVDGPGGCWGQETLGRASPHRGTLPPEGSRSGEEPRKKGSQSSRPPDLSRGTPLATPGTRLDANWRNQIRGHSFGPNEARMRNRAPKTHLLAPPRRLRRFRRLRVPVLRRSSSSSSGAAALARIQRSRQASTRSSPTPRAWLVIAKSS